VYSNFAQTNGEAEERARQFRTLDPYPTVPAALLSSAEVEDYARVTAMLHPFCPVPDRLKAASYEVNPGGRYTYWDEQGKVVQDEITAAGKYILRANSITFMQLESKFFLPDYIAARFNLRIKHVHRGILLGTGPLVDPGFKGNLLIPLHNLTSEDYEISGHEGLIWVEFTKTSWRPASKIRKLDDDIHARQGRFAPIPQEKTDLPPEVDFQKANGGRAIRSSIPDAIRVARDDSNAALIAAQTAETNASNARRLLRNLGILAGFGVVVALATIMASLYQSVQTTLTLAATVQGVADDAKAIGIQAQSAQTRNEGTIASLTAALSAERERSLVKQAEIESLRNDIKMMNERTRELANEIQDIRAQPNPPKRR
jgi:deoxycytidine triphosphate deaminase